MTRTIAARITAVLGSEVRELTAKASWVRDVPPDVYEATGVRQEQGGFSFRYGQSQFVYDRFGLRPMKGKELTRPLEEADDDAT